MIVLAYDHRGYKLACDIKKYLEKNKIQYIEFASKKYTATDSYSEFANLACKYILEHDDARGIFICGTGIGISMAGNRHKGIRAGLCHNAETTRLARNDDDINVLVLAGNTCGKTKATKLINIFLSTPFEGGRHIARLEMLDK